MKKLLVAAVLLAAGLVVYNGVTTGSWRLLPSASMSGDERAIADLERALDDARTRFAQAHRTAAVAGLDTTADVESARRSVARIEQDLAGLRPRLGDERAVRRADRLAAAVREFASQLK